MINHKTVDEWIGFPKTPEKKDCFVFVVVVVVVTGPFRGMGAWRKTMEPQRPGNSPGSGPEVVERQRISKKRAMQRVRCWNAQNEIRGVLVRVSAVAAGRILDSANSREIGA